MKTAEEIRKAYEEKIGKLNKAKMEVTKSVANDITEALFEDATEGLFSPDDIKYFTVSQFERKSEDGKYHFSGYEICGEELLRILKENGIEFEWANNDDIGVFLSK